MLARSVSVPVLASMSSMEAMVGLRKELGEIEDVEGMDALLFWDQMGMLPSGAQTARKRQFETLALILHERKTSPKLGGYLDVLNKQDVRGKFSAMEMATVREATRDYKRSVKIPAELEKRLAALKATGFEAWNQARKESKFELMVPVLEQWLEALKEEAAAVDPEMNAYDYCLDKHERKLTMQKVDAMFTSIKEPLIGLVRKVTTARKNTTSSSWSELRFPVDLQKKLGEKIILDMGFSLENGKVDDFGGHPMMIPISSPSDVRLATRYVEDSLISGIGATIHEAGHGLYEQGRAHELGLIASRPPSMGLHESQSLLWERSVGLTREFWGHYWPVVVEYFPGLSQRSSDEFYCHINEVKPGFIRVDSDELFYPLHVLLRYEIEKSLFDGSLRVQDIPSVWNAKMEEYIGLVPENDAQGCLQDVHWSVGSFGYFPTYVMGAIYACQIFEAANRDLEYQLAEQISQGKLLPLREWLREKIHSVGSTFETAEELVELVTGKPMDAVGFMQHLTRKYTDIYDFTP